MNFRRVVMQKDQFDPGSWETLNRLLDQALDLAPPEVEIWLESLAPEHSALKPRLRRLLSRSAFVETGDFLNTLPKLDLGAHDLREAPVSTEQPGDAVGPYRLLRELGSGGMGVVWLAERTDGLIPRPVALKLPHGAWKHAGLAERMVRERSILAALSHPNIAHLYDAGVTSTGQPYLAIEYIEGVRIDIYCREHSLDVRARLELFVQVARAVAYAHGKLVVHRDLKPANILVNDGGQVRLLDFGVAKLLEDGAARETHMTEMSGRALTPDYASPEQILGEPLTTASDVYSLGVVLFELLCERRPYKLARDSRGALEDAILQAEPPAPSSVAPEDRRRELRGDLDTIVLKALKKRPEDRYATVHAFEEDIDRYLGGHPVLARPDSWAYRLSRLVRRRKLAVSAGAAVAVVLVGATLYSLRQAQFARAEQKRAEQVEQFIASLLTDTQSAETLTAVGLLTQARARIRDEFADQPHTQVRLLTIVSRSLIGFSEYDAADEALEAALSISRSHSGESDPYRRQASLQRLTLHRLRGRLVQMREELGELRAEMIRDGDWPAADRVKLLIEAAYAANLDASDDQAVIDIQSAADLALRELGPRHELTLDAASARGVFLRGANRFDESIAAAEHTLVLMLAAYAPNAHHRRVLDARMALGTSYLSKGRIHDALRELRTVIDHAGDRDLLELYAQVHASRAWISGGEPETALKALLRAESLARNSNNADAVILSQAMALRAYALASMGQMQSALDLIDASLRRYALEYARDHPPTLAFRALRATILAHLGRSAEARDELQDIHAMKRNVLHWTLPHLSYADGVVERLAGNCERAVLFQRDALDAIGTDSSTWLKRAKVLGEIGLCASSSQDARAASSLREALSLLREHQTATASSDRFTLELQTKLASITG
jgi:serine/threonine protein kinase